MLNTIGIFKLVFKRLSALTVMRYPETREKA